jgi:hypothetical protein
LQKQEEQDVLSDLIREVYARFGLAYYHSECLHRELCNFLALSALPGPEAMTRPRVEERLAFAFSLTLGAVVDQLKPLVPDELFEKLQEAVEVRNFLAHHFWFERSYLMFTVPGLEQMIEELDGMSARFHELDETCSRRFVQKRRDLGISDEDAERILEESKGSGEPMEPLLSQRRLKKQERVVRAWNVTLSDGRVILIFETEDGCFWQLCDVGLGWTYYNVVEDNWNENKEMSPYLPVSLDPRPKGFKPWNYELRLSKGAVLWVRPGSRDKTLRWGIRKGTETGR